MKKYPPIFGPNSMQIAIRKIWKEKISTDFRTINAEICNPKNLEEKKIHVFSDQTCRKSKSEKVGRKKISTDFRINFTENRNPKKLEEKRSPRIFGSILLKIKI